MLTQRDKCVIHALNKLTPDYSKELTYLTKLLLPDWELNTYCSNPTERARLAISHRIEKKYRQHASETGMSPIMIKIWNHPPCRIKKADLPDVAERLGVSLHWLLGPDAVLIYTNNMVSEAIYDSYKCMTNEKQAIFSKWVSEMEGNLNAVQRTCC